MRRAVLVLALIALLRAPAARALLAPHDITRLLRGQHVPPPTAPPAAPAPAALLAGASAAGRRAAVVEGDIVLGALVPVHARASRGTCGRVRARGVQALEAMLFALDAATAHGLAPPGVRLGARVLDDCASDTYGLEVALDFVKGSLGSLGGTCGTATRSARAQVAGVLGAASSGTSVQVANLLRLFRIPQVSFYATSPELSNKARFEYFARTVASEAHRLRALVGVVRRLAWTYVSVLYDDSDLGIKVFEELESLLARSRICVAVKERLAARAGRDPRACDAAAERLLARPRARGVLVLAAGAAAACVRAAVARRNASDALNWVGAGAEGAARRGGACERVLEGAVSVQPRAGAVRGFREHFLNLTPENNHRNPWFVEYWEEQFSCSYGGAARRPGARACSGRERLPAGAALEPRLQFVADAVLAFVHALRDMHAELCAGAPGLCAAMRSAGGAALLRHLRRVRFTGLSGDEFQFDSSGDGPARYDVLHYRREHDGHCRWLRVGGYSAGALHLDMDAMQFQRESRHPPESVCSAECELGQAKQYVEGESCCWHCFNCTQYEIRSPLAETACAECPQGTLPDARRVLCVPLPLRAARAGAAATAAAAAGVLLTAATAALCAARRQAPVLRAAGTELCFVMLAALMLCHLVALALVLRPSDALCAVQRFGAGFGFAVVHAALLAMAPGAAPRARLARCGALAGVQLAALGAWQALAPARAVRHLPARDLQLLVCAAHVDASLALALLYPALLLCAGAVCAVRARRAPSAFDEAKHVGFTMYTTCVIWLAFVPLYFGTASHVPLRVTSTAVTISLSASVTLVCLFSPKLYALAARTELAAARGAVCAALVCAAPAAGGAARAHRVVQTEPEPLDARRLAARRAGVPAFGAAGARRRPPASYGAVADSA